MTVDEVADGPRPVHVLKVKFTPRSAGPLTKTLEFITDLQDQKKVVVPMTAVASSK